MRNSVSERPGVMVLKNRAAGDLARDFVFHLEDSYVEIQGTSHLISSPWIEVIAVLGF